MFHAEGKAGFNLGYIEGLADGRAGISGNSASASGRASVRFSPPGVSWPTVLNTENWKYIPRTDKEWGKLQYYPGGPPKAQASKALIPYVPNLSNKRVYNGHSGLHSISGGPTMYGFRRGYRRRVFRRRAVYRRRRFY